MGLNRFAAFVIGLFLLSPPLPARAELLSDIEMHGFVSQGYLKSTDNNYLGNSKKGSYEFNEIGVNLSADLTDDLKFGMQLFSRDMGEYGNNELTIDWAAFDYTYQDWLGFRAGKIKLPFGLHNRKRNADMLRTSIIFPQSVYPEGLREFVVGLYGAGLHGILRLGPLGYMDYELYGGTLHIASNTQYLSDLVYRYREVIKALGGNYDNYKLIINHMEGGMLIWNTPLTGLRIGGTSLMGKGEILVDPLRLEFSIDDINTLSAEYDIKSLTFTHEYMEMRIDSQMKNQSIYKAKLNGFYSEVNWQATDWFALSISYGEYDPNLKEPAYFGWQKDITVSTKFDISEYWCVKFETHFIDGLGLASLEENPADDVEREWMLFAVKTSLNF